MSNRYEGVYAEHVKPQWLVSYDEGSVEGQLLADVPEGSHGVVLGDPGSSALCIVGTVEELKQVAAQLARLLEQEPPARPVLEVGVSAAERRVERRRRAGDEHEVVTVVGGPATYRRWPCGGCPWRVDQTGAFPPEAFAHSAPTAYDLAEHVFACHEAGIEHSAVCAGFLLRGAEHNLTVRVRAARGQLDLEAVHDGGHELHADYRAMAVANGLSEDDPRLGPCR